MIRRYFLTVIALFSLFAGFDNLRKLQTLSLPATAFVATEGVIRATATSVDHNPGYEGGSFNTRVFSVTFEYDVGGAKRSSNWVSPVCSLCPAAVVVRATGVRPSQLAQGTRVTVYKLKEDESVAYLETPRREDYWQQLGVVVVWLFLVPGFAYVFIRLSLRDESAGEEGKTNGM